MGPRQRKRGSNPPGQETLVRELGYALEALRSPNAREDQALRRRLEGLLARVEDAFVSAYEEGRPAANWMEASQLLLEALEELEAGTRAEAERLVARALRALAGTPRRRGGPNPPAGPPPPGPPPPAGGR